MAPLRIRHRPFNKGRSDYWCLPPFPKNVIRRTLPSLLLCGLCLLATTAKADEAILNYVSDITIETDGRLLVKETIRVRAEGAQIKRGIYRDFPTLYKSKLGISVEVPFVVTRATRDGKQENYRLEKQANGVRVYLGRENVMLKTGEYEYTIEYETDYQLGFFDDHDELYWNATGNGWYFPIEQAAAIVRLPDSVPLEQVQTTVYTGPAGERGKDARASVNEQDRVVEFETTQRLARKEGLTIVVEFPKGHVEAPTMADLQALYWPAIRTLIVGVIAFAVVLVYYIFAWIRVGRDPPGGVIIPRFHPPEHMGPACIRFLRNMGYDRKCFSASILNLAVHRALLIQEDDDGEYTFQFDKRNPSDNGLPTTDRALLKQLSRNNSKLVIQQKNHSRLSKAIAKLQNELKKEYEGNLFRKNVLWLLPGWLLSLVAILVTVFSVGMIEVGAAIFMLLWGSIWSIGCLFLVGTAYSQWRAALAMRQGIGPRASAMGNAIFMTLFAIPFLVAEFVAFGFFVSMVGPTPPIMILALGVTGYCFWHWIKQPTVEGQRLMDHIEGFRMYLSTAERDYLQALHPPEKTPELFEEMLPFAVALDVENEWADQFTDVLAAASASPAESGATRHRYSPTWYTGPNYGALATGAFASTLASSMGSAISSSASPPGSSSGGGGSFGGGGSSGGGGGGGGGGGW